MIKKVVIPAAGLGTRFLPLTKNQPKEMLPVYNKPAIQYIIEEALSSDLKDILIVTGKGKNVIEDYFDRSYELEEFLKLRKEEYKLEEINKLIDDIKVFYIRQKKPLGLGDAIYQAKDFINEKAFAVMLADEIFDYEEPPIKRLIDIYNKYGGIILGLKEVEFENVSSYGIIKGRKIEKNIFEIEDLIEKPERDKAPSNIAIVGRYILTNSIFNSLEITKPGKNNEIQLTDAIRHLLGKEKIFGVLFTEKRFDVGERYGLLTANIYFGLKDNKIRESLIDFINCLINEKD